MVGRFVLGIGIGISAVVVPTYLGEVAPARLRGRMVELYEVMLCAGMLGSLLADVALMHVPGNWRWMVGMPFFPSAITACEMGCRVPGSAWQQPAFGPCCLPVGCCSGQGLRRGGCADAACCDAGSPAMATVALLHVLGNWR